MLQSVMDFLENPVDFRDARNLYDFLAFGDLLIYLDVSSADFSTYLAGITCFFG